MVHALILLWTVMLMNGNYEYAQLTESVSGTGVVLPALPDTADWHFVGWSESEFWSLSERPLGIVSEGTTVYPESDMTLWATYLYYPIAMDEPVIELLSGEYIYMNGETGHAIAGVPQNGKMSYAVADPTDMNQRYAIEFNAACDSATIKHVATGTYIGYNNSAQLASKASKWLVFHDYAFTGFYAIIKNKTYILFTDIPDGYGNISAGLFQTDNVSSTFTLLLCAREKPDVVYTCHPECEVGIHQVNDEMRSPNQTETTLMHFGGYKLVLKNGHKELRKQ